MSSSLSCSTRLRTVACVLVLLTCLAAVGATCAVCGTAHPGQAIERSLFFVPLVTAPPPTLFGGLLFAVAFAPFLAVRARLVSAGGSSPAELQRFLF